MTESPRSLTALVARRIAAVAATVPRVVSATVMTNLAAGGLTQVELDTGPGARVPARSLGALYAVGTRVSCLAYPPRGLLILGPIDASAGTLALSALKVGTIAVGSVTITPSAANTPTSLAVTGLGLTPGHTYHGFVTARTSVIGTVVLGVAATGVTASGLTVWVTRTDTTDTLVNYLVIAGDT